MVSRTCCWGCCSPAKGLDPHRAGLAAVVRRAPVRTLSVKVASLEDARAGSASASRSTHREELAGAEAEQLTRLVAAADARFETIPWC